MKIHELWEQVCLGSRFNDNDPVIIDFDKEVERAAIAIGNRHIGLVESRDATALACAVRYLDWEDLGDFDRYEINVALFRKILDCAVPNPTVNERSVTFFISHDRSITAHERGVEVNDGYIEEKGAPCESFEQALQSALRLVDGEQIRLVELKNFSMRQLCDAWGEVERCQKLPA